MRIAKPRPDSARRKLDDACDWYSAPASYFGDEDDGPFILLVRPRRMIAPLALQNRMPSVRSNRQISLPGIIASEPTG